MNNQPYWKNNNSRMYTAGAARIIETQTILPFPAHPDQPLESIIRPIDTGIVFYKVIIDNGGYEVTHLKMEKALINVTEMFD